MFDRNPSQLGTGWCVGQGGREGVRGSVSEIEHGGVSEGRIQNTQAVNKAGRPTAYKLVLGTNCLPLALPEAKFLWQAAFLKHNLWITLYHPEERFPGGEFPNQNPRVDDWLSFWVQQNMPIDNAGVVLW
ncbi:unnamed protein product [Closterium sp. NIES-53]